MQRASRAGAGRAAVILLALAVFLGGCGRAGPPAASPPAGPPEGPEVESPPPVPERPCPLCGQQVPEDLLQRRPFALMIDNAPQARPQAGLAEACLVYEVLAEGGVTRFLAFFLHADPARAGPVRSVRPYFLDLVLPLNAVLGHAGGSEQGLAEVRTLKVPHLDEIYGGGDAYWRLPPSERKPPHATYTSGELFRRAMQKRGLEGAVSVPSPFTFDTAGGAAEGGTEAGSLTVRYPGGWQGYTVGYEYDPDGDRWLRSVDGEPHRDEDGRVLWARNVVVQFVEMRRIPGDELLHMEAKMTGQGRVLLARGGRVLEGTWRKADRRSPAVYRDAAGKPLVLEPGPTWVLVVPVGTRVDTE